MAWPTTALSDLCEINIGRTPPRDRSDYWGEGMPWLSIADMNQGRLLRCTKEQISDLAVREVMGGPIAVGTIALSFKLSIGKVGVIETPMFTNEAIATLPIRETALLIPEFLYWALKTIDVARDTDRAAMGQTLNKAKLARLQIPLPPLAQQRRIADVLDRVDALRAQRRTAVALLGDIPQAIFHDMFGDPIENPRNYRIRLMVDWVDTARPITYGILKPGRDQVDGIKYVRVVDMKAGGIDTTAIRKTSPAISRQYRRSVLKHQDLLISIRGHVGRVAQVPADLEGANITQDSARLAVPAESARYVMECLRSASLQRWMSRRTKGMAVQGINLADIKVIPIPDPPLALQHEFANRCAPVGTLLSSHRNHLAELDALFAAVQYRAFRGELWEDAATGN